jgi:hypothetical protein
MYAIDMKLLIAVICTLSSVIGALFLMLKTSYERQLSDKDKEIDHLRNKVDELYSMVLRKPGNQNLPQG